MTKIKPENIFVAGPIAATIVAECIREEGSRTETGAHSIFLGQVRSDVMGDKKIAAIEYTAYEKMANKQMDEIRQSAADKYQLTGMKVLHSLGKVAAGEISLFVCTFSIHRKEAMEACREVVERIKSELPVWGKEMFDDDSYQWKQNRQG